MNGERKSIDHLAESEAVSRRRSHAAKVSFTFTIFYFFRCYLIVIGIRLKKTFEHKFHFILFQLWTDYKNKHEINIFPEI